MKKAVKAIAAIMLMTMAVCIVGCNKDDDSDDWGGNNNSDVRVITYTPRDVSQTTAVCGGDAIVMQGLTLTELGVCWSTEHNPTASDAHLTTASWSEPFVCTITGLEPGTTYHVRAYALRGLEYYYGEEKSFTTDNTGGGCGNHTWVDLGLPSGTLWATCNVGADTPEDYGDYFAWGETQPKDYYGWNTYKYGYDSHNLIKYCNISNFGYNGYTDNLTILMPTDDAATINWGNDWCMPTEIQWRELWDNTTQVLTYQNHVNGCLFTASNGQTLFLPCAGEFDEDGYSSAGFDGVYWSSSLDTGRPEYSWHFEFSEDGYSIHGYFRQDGLSVRPVRCYDNGGGGNSGNGGNGSYNGHDYVDLGLPSGTLWATCNVGADIPEDYGDCYAWGEIEPKDYYNWSNYKYCNGTSSTLTKYCYSDNLTILLPEDDAATANLGSGWHIPTHEQWQELIDNTTHTWITLNGVNGRLYTASNGYSLFLPAAGDYYGNNLLNVGSVGDYWSNSLYTGGLHNAWDFCFNSDHCGMSNNHRSYGRFIRAVHS